MLFYPFKINRVLQYIMTPWYKQQQQQQQQNLKSFNSMSQNQEHSKTPHLHTNSSIVNTQFKSKI